MILVVDDNETMAYRTSRILRQAGFEVRNAFNGEDALRAIAVEPPRLVVLDVSLPGMDGWEVCRRIKSDPATASILVLQLSATYVEQMDTVRALEGGADACLTVPLEAPVLVATVRALLRARQAEDALRESLAREQAARRAAESANRAKDEFLATLSHELRSPLGTILNWVTLLRGGRLETPDATRALVAIDRNARLQSKLIEDLLDVSRIVSGRLHIDRRPVAPAPVLDAAIEAIRPAARAKQIVLEVAVAGALPELSADPARLQQVLTNLLSNAVKFTPPRGHVRVAARPRDGCLEIVVQDSGAGIEPAFLPHIFERFRQADSSTTRREGGLGLGLAIVHHIVELHGGSIAVHSGGAGTGATFTVVLPAAAPPASVAEDGVVPATEPAAPPPDDDLRGLRLLVVDDDPDAREAEAAVLRGGGADVRAVASVSEALESLAHEPVDLLISDIAMPNRDGYALIRAVRGLPGRTAGVPVIALTAFASEDERRRATEAGFLGYLAKPTDPGVLLHTVAALVREGRGPDV